MGPCYWVCPVISPVAGLISSRRLTFYLEAGVWLLAWLSVLLLFDHPGRIPIPTLITVPRPCPYNGEASRNSVSLLYRIDGPSVTTGPQLKHKSNVLRQGKKLPMPASVHAPARPAAIQSRSSSQQPAQNVPIPIKNTRACIFSERVTRCDDSCQ